MLRLIPQLEWDERVIIAIDLRLSPLLLLVLDECLKGIISAPPRDQVDQQEQKYRLHHFFRKLITLE